MVLVGHSYGGVVITKAGLTGATTAALAVTGRNGTNDDLSPPFVVMGQICRWGKWERAAAKAPIAAGLVRRGERAIRARTRRLRADMQLTFSRPSELS